MKNVAENAESQKTMLQTIGKHACRRQAHHHLPNQGSCRTVKEKFQGMKQLQQ
jgi:hypothetical protein